MSRRDEVKYKRLSNNSDDFETQQPLLASGNGRTTGVEAIALVQRRSAFYGPTRGAESSDRLEPTQLRARGESATLARPSSRVDEQPACFERDINPGETLTSLSVQYSCPVSVLKQVNHLVADQEFYGLKVIRVPTKKHGLLYELLALENEENRQRLMATATGRAPQQAVASAAAGIASIAGLVGIPEPMHVAMAATAVTAEPGSPAACSDPSDNECDPLLYESHSVGRTSAQKHRVDRGGSSSPHSGAGSNPLSDFLKAKDEELKSIAARMECSHAASASNDTMMLMRTSPTFPLQIQRTRRNSGSMSIGVRWAIASVVIFVLIILIGIIAVILLKTFHAS